MNRDEAGRVGALPCGQNGMSSGSTALGVSADVPSCAVPACCLARCLLVVVVLDPADDVDPASFAEVLGRGLGLLAPEGPEDRGDLFLPLGAAALPDVGDGDGGALAERAVLALDDIKPDPCGQTGVSLFDS